MRQLRDFIGMYRLLRRGGNPVCLSVRRAWWLMRHNMRPWG